MNNKSVSYQTLEKLKIKQAAAEEDVVTANSKVVSESRSYEEYRLKCTIYGVEPLYTESDFASAVVSMTSWWQMNLS